MEETPISASDAKNLRFLRLLVTVLTATMILGLLTIVALFVIRFSADARTVRLPDAITLPDGVRAAAFTQGFDWYAIVTQTDEILIYNADDNTLRQKIKINGK